MQRTPTRAEFDAMHLGIGRGIWHLQHVEHALQILLALKLKLKTPGSVPAGTAKIALAKYQAKTLGSSLRSAREGKALPEALLSQLDTFLEERNWLVHRSIESHGDDIYDEIGYTEALNRLARFSSMAVEIRNRLIREVEEFATFHGISTQEAAKRASAKMEQLKGGNGEA